MNIKKTISSLSATTVITIAFALGAHADVITFSTSESQFDSGVHNQGFWINNTNATDGNDNFFTGNQTSSIINRSFFTFDLSSLGALDVITSADLKLRRFSSSGNNEETETVEFFDVSTDAATLNNNSGQNAAIYADLGTGTSYGSFSVAGSGTSTDVLTFSLEPMAISDMNVAKGGFFSIGGTLQSSDGNDWLFGNSGGVAQSLEVNFTTIPEPGCVGAMFFASTWILARRKRRVVNR